MHFVIVVANSYSEFRDLVLKDVSHLGPGSVTFTGGPKKIVRFRSSEDPEFIIQYVWTNNYQEVENDFDQDNFRVISGAVGAKSKKAEILHGIIFVGLVVIAFGITIFFILNG